MARNSDSTGRTEIEALRRNLVHDPLASARMSKIRQQGTLPELVVRQVLHTLGLRYRTVNRDLPGSPDIANRSKRWAVFVHGCYWHAHRGCRLATVPKRNRAYWVAKFEDNHKRDLRSVRALRRMGFLVVTIWQCELKRLEIVSRKLAKLIPS